MTTVAFTVFGDPMPKGSGTKTASGFVIEARRPAARKKFDAWTTAVKVASELAHDGPPLDGPLAVTVTFYLRRPKHETRAQRLRLWHATKPDADKLLRALFDPMKRAGTIADDSRIAIARVEKRFAPSPAETGAKVHISQIAEGD